MSELYSTPETPTPIYAEMMNSVKDHFAHPDRTLVRGPYLRYEKQPGSAHHIDTDPRPGPKAPPVHATHVLYVELLGGRFNVNDARYLKELCIKYNQRYELLLMHGDATLAVAIIDGSQAPNQRPDFTAGGNVRGVLERDT